MPDSVQPRRQQPTRLAHPWDSPGKNTGVGCHFLLQCMKVKSLSHVQLIASPWTAAYEAPPSMGFSRQEYWSGVPLPSPSFWQSGKLNSTTRNSFSVALLSVTTMLNWLLPKIIYSCLWGHTESDTTEVT